MEYTVVGYYEDNGQTWIVHTSGKDESMAVVNAVKHIEKLNGLAKNSEDDEREYIRKNICIVEVFRGHLIGQTDSDHVSSAIDWPGLGI